MPYASPYPHTRKPLNPRGFTLIELMVVLIIISSLSVAGYVNYTGYNNDQRLRQTAQTFLNNLRLAQTDASAAKIPAGCANFGGYQVTFLNSSYTINAVCTVPGPSTQYAMTPDITFHPLPDTLLFGPLTNGISISGQTCIVLHSNSSNKDYKILVDPAGNINDGGFTVTPASCP